MNQNTNTSQDNQAFPISVFDLIEDYFLRETNTTSESFYALMVELVNVNTFDSHNLKDGVVNLTTHSLISIAQILLTKLESYIDSVIEKFPQNEDLKHINDLISHLTVALHDLDVTTIGERYKGSLVFGLSVVAKDLDSLIQDIPEILEVISKENANA